MLQPCRKSSLQYCFGQIKWDINALDRRDAATDSRIKKRLFPRVLVFSNPQCSTEIIKDKKSKLSRTWICDIISNDPSIRRWAQNECSLKITRRRDMRTYESEVRWSTDQSETKPSAGEVLTEQLKIGVEVWNSSASFLWTGRGCHFEKWWESFQHKLLRQSQSTADGVVGNW